MKACIVGIMGPGEDVPEDVLDTAFKLGQKIANQGWIVLTGGRNHGVMDAASRGAKDSKGIVIGILPSYDTSEVSDGVSIPIFTGIGEARNIVNVLSSDIVVSCGVGLGTIAEVAYALKGGKKVIMLHPTDEFRALFTSLAPDDVIVADDTTSAVQHIFTIVGEKAL